MKKLVLCWLVVLLFLTGCSNSNVPQIEDYNWIMTSVQSKETNGQAVAFGDRGTSTLASAKQIEMTCTAQNGNLTFNDQTNHKTYTGTYKLSETDPQSSIYQVVVEGKEGVAVIAMTTYQDGSEEPTFIINLDEYTVNFFAK